MNRKKYLVIIVIIALFSALLFAEPGDTEDNIETKIKLIVAGGNETIFSISDNAASRDFLALLPLTLNFEDYNRTEKVSSLPARLSTEGTPDGYDPNIGDLCLYAPWGNLCIFYRDFGYAAGLIKLGHLISGENNLGNIEGPVLIEEYST